MSIERSSKFSPVLLGFFLLFVLAGGFFLDLAHRSYQAGSATWNWIETEGTLLYAQNRWEYQPAASMDESGWKVHFELNYVYSDRRGDDVKHFRSSEFDVYTEQHSYWLRFIGRWAMIEYARYLSPKVNVYFNPDQPEESVLWQGPPFETALYLTLSMFFLYPVLRIIAVSLGDYSTDRPEGSKQGQIFFASAVSVAIVGVCYLSFFYSLAPLLRRYVELDLLLLLFPLSVVVWAFVGPYVASAPRMLFTKFLGTVAVWGAMGFLLLGAIGFGREIYLSRSESLSHFEYTTEELVELLESDNTKLLSWVTYQLVRRKEKPAQARAFFLGNLESHSAEVRKASLHALDQYHNFSEEELSLILQRIPVESIELVRKISFFLGKRRPAPAEEVITVARPLLGESAEEQEAAFRILFTLGRESIVLKEEILGALASMKPGPSFAFGFKVLKRFDTAVFGIDSLMLRALNSDSSASQLSVLYYLIRFPEVYRNSGESLREEILDIQVSGNRQWRGLANKILGAQVSGKAA